MPITNNERHLGHKLINQLKSRTSDKKRLNAIILINGSTGSGKSWYSLSLASALDKSFNEERIYFSLESLLRDLTESDKIKPRQSIVLEEMGVSAGSRDFMTKQNKNFSKLFQTVRSRRNYIILNLPSISMLDSGLRKLIHYQVIMSDIDRRKRISYGRIYSIEQNEFDGRYYRRTPQLRIDNISYKLVFFGLKAPTDLLIKQYEQRKQEFQDNLYGTILSEIEESNLKKNTRKIITQEEIDNIIKQIGNTDKFLSNRGGLKTDLLAIEFKISMSNARIVNSFYLKNKKH